MDGDIILLPSDEVDRALLQDTWTGFIDSTDDMEGENKSSWALVLSDPRHDWVFALLRRS